MNGAAMSGGAIQAGPVGINLPERFVVTIDGQAATGKSSTGLKLAKRLGAAFLDTGAMYRDATALALEHRVPVQDAGAIIDLVKRERTGWDWVMSPGKNYAGMSPAFSARLRSREVDDAVSVVAKHADLRLLMVEWQRGLATSHKRLVSEGRDQGSVVFRDVAAARFFLMAEPAERARRRVAQLASGGIAADAAKIEANLRSRDAIDASHAMKIAEGMEVIDTTRHSEDEVVDRLVGLVMERVGRG